MDGWLCSFVFEGCIVLGLGRDLDTRVHGEFRVMGHD